MATVTGVLQIDTSPALKGIADLKTKISSLDATKIPLAVDTKGATTSINNFTKTSAAQGAAFGAEFKNGLTSSLAGSGGIGAILSGGLAGGLAGGIPAAIGATVEGIKSVINIGADFETAQQSLSAVTGVTGAALTDLTSRARDLAKTYGGDAKTQVAGFQTLLSKFGTDLAKSPEAIAAVSNNVNLLAKAAGLNAQQSVEALANSMLQFGISADNPAVLAKESARFINVLAASAKEGAAEIPQLTEAVLQVGATASGLGISFESANAAIQGMATGGKVGSEAGIGLRNVMLAMVKPSKEAEDGLAAIGISGSMLGDKLTKEGLPAVLETLRAGLNKLPDATQRAALLTTLFGRENTTSAQILLNNVDVIKEYEKRITGTSEALTAAKANMATFSESLSRVGAFIQDIAIGAFQAVSDFVTFISARVMPVVQPAMDAIGGAFERLWTTIKPILTIIGGLIIANMVTTMQFVATTVTVLFNTVNTVFDAIVSSLKPVIEQFSRLFGGVSAGTDPMKTFTQLLDGAGAAMRIVGEFLSELIKTAVSFGKIIIDIIVTAVKPLITWFTTLFTSTQNVGNAVASSGSKFQDLIEFFNKIRLAIIILRGQFEGFSQVIRDFFDAWSNLDFGRALKTLTGAGDTIQKGGAAALKAYLDARKQKEESDKQEAEAEKKKEEDAKKKAAADEAAQKKAAARTKKKADADKDVKTELETALALYEQQEQRINKIYDQERARIKILQSTGALTKEQADIKLKELDSKEAAVLVTKAQLLLKTKVDELGLFVSSGIELVDNETDEKIRTITNDLAQRVSKSAPTVKVPAKLELVKTINIEDVLPKGGTVFGTKLAVDISSSFVDAFGKLNIVDIMMPEKAAKEVDNRVNDITKSMKDGITSYQDAMKQIGDETKKTTTFVNRLKTAFTELLNTEFANSRRNISQALADYQQNYNAKQELDSQTFENEKDRVARTQELDAALAKDKEAFYKTIGKASGQVAALMLTDTKAAGKAVKSLAVDIAGGLLAIYAAPLISSFLVFLGPFAVPAATAIITFLKGMLAAAVASFDTGGATGGRKGEVRGVVHGGEWVARPDVYERNKELLDYFHRGGDLNSYLNAHTLASTSTQTDVAPMSSTFEKLTYQLGSLVDRIDRSARTTKTQTAVSIDVGFDNYLYERQRRRVAIRGLR